VSISELQFGPSTVLEQTWLLTLRIQNPNNYDIPADGMKYQIDVNGKFFARGVNNQSVMVPRLGEAMIQVQAVSDLPTLIQQVGDLRRLSQTGIDYYMSGMLYSGEWRYPFEYSGAVTLAQ
ncbi:MAG TPA: LEA type 2 family protein, partial [Burkholderiales bacterium]